MTLPETIYSDLKAQLPALTEAIKQGAEWGTDLAHRFIVYDMVKHGIWVAFTVVGAVVLSILICKAIKRIALVEDYDDKFDLYIFLGLVLFFLVPFLVIVMVVNTSIILKDLFVPEIRIGEILSELSSPAAK